MGGRGGNLQGERLEGGVAPLPMLQPMMKEGVLGRKEKVTGGFVGVTECDVDGLEGAACILQGKEKESERRRRENEGPAWPGESAGNHVWVGRDRSH